LNWDKSPPEITKESIQNVAKEISGSTVALPYPTFSSRTVQGKPLHIWTLENRLDEITIPTATTDMYKLTCIDRTVQTAESLTKNSLEKIETIPTVTEASKQLGADFRRKDVRASWNEFYAANPNDTYTIASFECICSSGTYMRSLAEYIGKLLDTRALALAIHRTKIGRYQKLPFNTGFWTKSY
ncbi:MAG: hypothetical protein WDZ45_01180, partial [Flavobacteriaceae bacterium]